MADNLYKVADNGDISKWKLDASCDISQPPQAADQQPFETASEPAG